MRTNLCKRQIILGIDQNNSYENSNQQSGVRSHKQLVVVSDPTNNQQSGVISHKQLVVVSDPTNNQQSGVRSHKQLVVVSDPTNNQQCCQIPQATSSGVPTNNQQWCHKHLVVVSPQTKVYLRYICCFSLITQPEGVRKRLNGSQFVNVFVFSDMSTCGLLLQSASTINIKISVLVQTSRHCHHHHHLFETLFLPGYC